MVHVITIFLNSILHIYFFEEPNDFTTDNVRIDGRI